MKRILPFLIIFLVGAATVGGGWYFYAQKMAAATAQAKQQTTEPNKAEPGVGAGAAEAPSVGPATAAVTIEEYADFQCPPCGRVSPALKQVQSEHADKVRIVFRHFPLLGHQHAKAAAYAAEAAKRQGKFWEMHDLLFQNQTVWAQAQEVRSMFAAYAASLRLDLTKFQKDFDDPDVHARVAADQERGTRQGVANTPTVFVNGQQVPFAQLKPELFRGVVTEALQKGGTEG